MRSLIVEQLASRIADEVIMEQEYPIGFENDYPKEYRNKRRTLLGRGPTGAPYGKGGWEFDAYVRGIPLKKHPEYKRSVNFDRVERAAAASKHGMPGRSRPNPGIQIRDMFDADGNPVGRQTERVSAETGRTRTMNPTRTLTSNPDFPRMVSALPDQATDLATMRRTTPTRIETGFDRAAAGLRNLERNVSNITPRQALGVLGRGAGGAATVAGAGLSGYDIGNALVGDGGEGFFDRPAQTDLAADAATRGAGYEFGPASPYNTSSVGSKAAQYGQNLATGTVDNFKDAISSSGLANLIPAVPLAKMAMSQSMLPFDALRGSEVEYDDTVETDSPDGPITQAGREALVAHRTGDHVGSRSDIEDRIAHARRRRAIAPELERKAMGY